MEQADTVQVTFRLPRAWLVKLDSVASRLSQPGLPLSRTDALRMAVARGLIELEQKEVGRAQP